MTGIRERYESALRRSAAEELKEARAEVWTNIDANINRTKSCELEANRDATERRRGGGVMYMDLEERLDSLLWVIRNLMQRLRAAGMESDDARYRDKSLVRNIEEGKRMVI